jgi:hypothetical protein
LELWIDHKRPSVRVLEDNGIVDRELILRQFFNKPLPNPHLIAQNGIQTDLIITLDVEVPDHADPVLDAVCSIHLHEHSEIGDATRAHEDITHDILPSDSLCCE